MVARLRRLLEPPAGSFFLFGARGTGKSTWLRQHFASATYIDLLDERLFHSYLVDPGLLAHRLEALPRGARVVIDEIQRLPSLLNEAHRFIESKKLEFALSGSSARKLRKAGTNLLAGRAVHKALYPLVPEELGEAFDLERVLTHGSLALVWDRGGDRDVLEAYMQTYLREEIQAEALVRNLPGFARFLPVAALFHGQVLNAAALARDAGVSRTTVLAYLDILEDTLLAFRLPPYEGRLRVKEKRHPKLYWIDPGLARAARRRFGPVVEEERGALFEGWLATLLRAYRSYRHLFEDWNYWAPTESSALEVDFLLWRDDACVAIEAKASRRFRPEHARGVEAFAQGYRGKRRPRTLVVYLGADRLQTPGGTQVLPLQVFLAEMEGDRLFG
ncbi:MAG: ATP-binding protein [Deltaproteobacteria bacterium]|nr:ATP-binding protein [Deltaproteobacteria bacterium]